MITELTFAVLKYAFLILLWVFVWVITRSLYKDVAAYSPRKSRARRRKEREVRKQSDSVPAPAQPAAPLAAPRATQSTVAGAGVGGGNGNASPTLLVIIDGPLAGTSVPLNSSVITLGRVASNTVVLDDEFVSSHHARVYPDAASGSWAIEDLHSTNGTVVNQQRISTPTILAPRVPVRIGATTFELR
mgnify:FL=1